ncbi:MAG TPA: hypothetical protein VET89_11610 [Stellaceae bacterium]|nr:hypothetical protein [Stellaceae bacterium]
MRSWTARLGLAAAMGTLALLVVLVAVWFLGEAAYLQLQTGMEPAAAAAVVGGGGVVLAAIFGWIGWMCLHPPRAAATPATVPAPPPSTGSVVNDIALELGKYAAQRVETATRSHPYTTVGAALAAGLAVGAIPELRKLLTDLIKP